MNFFNAKNCNDEFNKDKFYNNVILSKRFFPHFCYIDLKTTFILCENKHTYRW